MFRMSCKIALASLRRRRSRTLLVIAMIGMSLWGLLLLQGIYDGMMEQMISNAVRSDSGDVTVFGSGYRLENDLDQRLPAATVAELMRFLRNDPRVRSSVQRLEQEGLVATAHYSRGVRIIGIVPEAEAAHGRLDDYLRHGQFSFGRRGHEAILGAALAEKLKVKIGSKIILSAQAADREISSLALKVRGIVRTNNMDLDERVVYLDLAEAAKLLRVSAGEATRLSVILHQQTQAQALQAALAPRFAGVEVLRWDELYPALLQSREMMQLFNWITGFLVFSAAAIGIVGVMLVSVLERIREFGIMAAIGTSFGQISTLVLIESMLLGGLGYLAGIIPGWLTLYYFQQKGLDLTMFSSALAIFGMDAITHALIRPGYFVASLGAVAAATLISVVIPLRVLRRAKPIRAIQGL